MNIVQIDTSSNKPKYRQIVSSIENAIGSGELRKGDQLPSLNKIRDDFSLSRDTVLMAFKDLRSRGIIKSVVGKGYYVQNENIKVRKKVFLLFDELNAFKEDLYRSIIASLGESVQVDIFFHHFNPKVFRNLLEQNLGDYTYYVIMPANLPNVATAISVLPQDKVYILDQTNPELSQYPSVHQNFERNIFEGLNKIEPALKKYDKIVLLFNRTKQPVGILKGFKLFCTTLNIPHEVVEELGDRIPSSKELFFVLDDINLVQVIKKAKNVNLILGKDYGIISYNETLLKEIVEGGITTISADFYEMGKKLAEIMLSNDFQQIESENKLIIRNSI
jgi:DNA-binding transcriptional regulator YhcF (GntR family)